MAQTNSSVHMRVNTVLLLCAMVFLPWAAYWFPPPQWLGTPYAGRAFSFVAYDFSAQLLGVGGIIALLSVPWFAVKRLWRSAIQAAVEFSLALGAISVLPAY
jgi:hypothetical protein